LQGVDVPVFAIAGKWECSQQGKWEFVIENDRFARSICRAVPTLGDIRSE